MSLPFYFKGKFGKGFDNEEQLIWRAKPFSLQLVEQMPEFAVA